VVPDCMELIKQTQNTSSLENKFDEKFDKLMNMMMMMTSSSTNPENPSPLRKKGKPTNLDEKFSQIDTPTRSNTTDPNHPTQHVVNAPTNDLPEEDMTDSDVKQSEQSSQNDETKMDMSYEIDDSDDDGTWITPKERTKERKEKLNDNPYINKWTNQTLKR
jgi:hypothetical protein